MNRLIGSTLVIISLGACGKGGDKAESKQAAKQAVAIDVAAVNALVPAALKDKIEFEKRDLLIERGSGDRPDKTTYSLAVPKNWTQTSKMWANLKADDKGGFFTTMKVGNDCDGECKPKAWEQIADKNFFQPRAKGKVLKDEKVAGKRTMIAEVDSGGAKLTEVVVAWWTDGDSNYHTCVASLDEAVKDAAPAFDKACQAVNIEGKD